MSFGCQQLDIAPGRLSVLKSHFDLVSSFVLNSCIVFGERGFVRTIDLQKGFSLSEAVNDGSGNEMVWIPKDLKSVGAPLPLGQKHIF